MALILHATGIPYTAANTGLHNVFPNWVLDGGIKKELERLKDKATREKIKMLQQAKKISGTR